MKLWLLNQARNIDPETSFLTYGLYYLLSNRHQLVCCIDAFLIKALFDSNLLCSISTCFKWVTKSICNSMDVWHSLMSRNAYTASCNKGRLPQCTHTQSCVRSSMIAFLCVSTVEADVLCMTAGGAEVLCMTQAELMFCV